MAPRTSVIMPVYKTENSVVRAIQSVLAQDDADLELLVMIDGSPDNSAQVIRDYLAQNPDERVRVFDNPTNQGVSAVRNQGLDEARGEWIAFIDSDDRYRPTFLSTLHAYAQAQFADIVGSLFSIVTPAGGDPVDRQGADTKVMTGEEAGLSLLMGTSIAPYVCDKIFRAELFEGLRFPLNIHRGEDGLTALSACLAARRVVMTNEALYEYFMEETGLTWGRIAPVEETLELLDLQKERLGALAQTPEGQKALDVSRIMTLLNNAQQALVITNEESKKTVLRCRQLITWQQVFTTLPINKMFGAAAALLKVSPALYSKLYGLYIKRTYGL